MEWLLYTCTQNLYLIVVSKRESLKLVSEMNKLNPLSPGIYAVPNSQSSTNSTTSSIRSISSASTIDLGECFHDFAKVASIFLFPEAQGLERPPGLSSFRSISSNVTIWLEQLKSPLLQIQPAEPAKDGIEGSVCN